MRLSIARMSVLVWDLPWVVSLVLVLMLLLMILRRRSEEARLLIASCLPQQFPHDHHQPSAISRNLASFHATSTLIPFNALDDIQARSLLATIALSNTCSFCLRKRDVSTDRAGYRIQK